MKPNSQLITFLKPYSPSIQNLTLELRDYITELIPECNELIWDNYNAVAMAYSKSEVLKDAFCHIAVYAKYVNFGFNRGTELTKPPAIQLAGTGKLIRHIKVTNFNDFRTTEMEKLIWEALAIAERRNEKLKDKTTFGISKVMSVSEKKRRPQ